MFAAVAAAALVAGSASYADGPAITGFTGGGGPFASFYGGILPDVVGYRFTADADSFVTALGVTNASDPSILNGSHEVGLWRDSDQALLAMVVVGPGSTLIGDWHYEDIAAVALTAGERYTVGAGYSSDDGDTYWSGPSSLSLDGISDTVGVFPSVADLGFVYPDSESPGNLGRLGPNMIISSVPAPGALALLGLAGIATRRRRRS
jgi:MYXO-CTERM domain-containing protein